jgi:hypothetical protein
MRRRSLHRQKRSECLHRTPANRSKNIENLKFYKVITELLVIDPYNDFISERGKVWNRLKTVLSKLAEGMKCFSPNVLQNQDRSGSG